MVYLLQDVSSKYILRLSAKNKHIDTSEEDYLFETELLDYLHKKNFPVANPVKWITDSFVLSISYKIPEFPLKESSY